MSHARKFLLLAATASFAFAACGGGVASSAPNGAASAGAASAVASPGASAAALDEVRLQLQWLPQAQFAGYFAAVEQGYYEAAGLRVTILGGGPDVIPQAVGSAADGPEFTISWVPKVLEAREGMPASDLVDIAQVFQRSGTLSVSWTGSNITSPIDFKDKKVGLWGSGNELEVTAAAKKAGLAEGTDYTKVTQPTDMTLLLSKQVDVAEAMVYNEYAQLLEAVDPETGDLNKPADFNVINYKDVGTSMLQDAIFARASWLAEAGHQGIATRFLKASFQGWIYCRANPADCVQYTVAAGSNLGAGHQAWMMNEINPLIWPSPNGIGMMDPAEWQQSVNVGLTAGIIKASPPAEAYRTDLASAALAGISDDTQGADFKKGDVQITEGGN